MSGKTWSSTGFAPDGRRIATFAVPAAQSSCPCFAGPGLDRMIVTAAWQGMDATARRAHPGAGHTFLIDGRFRGRAEADFRLDAE